MQYDPTKLNLNYKDNAHVNQYPSANQQHSRTGNTYQPYQSPLPYRSYVSPSANSTEYVVPNVQYHGQPPLYLQKSLVVVPNYRSFWANDILTQITPNIKAFLVISAIIYMIWYLVIIGSEITIIIQSYWALSRSIWTSGFILFGSIFMLIIVCKKSYSMVILIKVSTFILFFCLFGMILSTINYTTSEKCSSRYSNKYSCDQKLINILKMTNMIIFIITIIHTLINIIVFTKIHKKTLKLTIPNH